jgi:hypothetical protein
MNKPIVHYKSGPYTKIEVGLPAWVFPVDHTSPFVSNEDVARTSSVIWYNAETGDFETQNSRYVLQPKGE